MVREALSALSSAGLAVEGKQGGWVPARDPARITLAQVRAAARSTLRYPAREPDDVSHLIARAFAQAEVAAASSLDETVESFVRRLEAPPAETEAAKQPTPEPAARPIGVGQSAQKPA
jgi:DNA-binding IscR family transcriptional regulator